MMYGMMVLSIVYMFEGKVYKSALTYAVLLQFKHIYFYSAPAYGIMYLKMTIFNPNKGWLSGFGGFIILAVQTIFVFALAYAPVIQSDPSGIMKQIFSRLFPFNRGLVHDYIAGNFWGLIVLI